MTLFTFFHNENLYEVRHVDARIESIRLFRPDDNYGTEVDFQKLTNEVQEIILTNILNYEDTE